ncbi:MAG: hypothetical protein AAFR67_06225, partial [Chloroflexota bacterium]
MKQIWTWLGGFTVVVVLGIVTFFTFQNYLELRTIEAINVQFEAYSALDGDTIAGLIDARADAEQAVELAFNLLGLFEAMSLVITVGGVVLTAFGLTRFTTARNELEEARKLVERELEEARDRFEGAIVEREQELSEMRADLTAAAQNDRQRTSDALLANALIP